MISIVAFSELSQSKQCECVSSQVDLIFFSSSSRQNFKSENERNHFRFKYLDWYRINNADLHFVALNSHGEVLGYVCGTPDTKKANELFEFHPWFEQLTSHFDSFPAHLHINLAETARGLGIGSLLIETLESSLKSRSVHGVHIVTSPDARNVGFYKKNGYNFETVLQWKNAHLLFMGKQL
ncbi:MAG: hypothetical protein RJB13_1430 [Pseudomonadota bacterium]|jgi:ribosomal protein S18 acetylase RimI-like enzyme